MIEFYQAFGSINLPYFPVECQGHPHCGRHNDTMCRGWRVREKERGRERKRKKKAWEQGKAFAAKSGVYGALEL